MLKHVNHYTNSWYWTNLFHIHLTGNIGRFKVGHIKRDYQQLYHLTG